MDLPGAASVVVVGGGVMGTSVAFHLAEAGVDGVLLLERGELAGGSTSRAAGGVRAMFSDELNVRMALRSLEALDDFGRRPGAEIDLRRVGYLFLLDREADVERFRRDVAMHGRLGLPSELLAPAEARERCPVAGTDGVLAAAFDPLAGHATPEAVVQGYAAGARAHGARVITRCPVEGIELAGGRIRGVRAGGRIVAAESVVCCAGAWSRAVGEMAGVELPVTPFRRQVAFTGALPDLPADLPMTIDFASGLYFHREGPGVLFGMADPDEPAGFATATDDRWLELAEPVMRRRAPFLVEAPIRGGWAGLYEVTPDHNALIGEAPAPSRFLYATGFSGHGFLQGPAAGEVVRDLYLGAKPFVDAAPLSALRFAGGHPRRERNVV
jgi:sarcosine oxidase, subunit beta